MVTSGHQSLPMLLAGLRAAGEETRLRILGLLAEGELSVSDMTDILGQSQPRISRHLKLMAEAGLIERHREGAWAFFRLQQGTAQGALAKALAETISLQDPVMAADLERLAAVRSQRSQAAQSYFTRVARDWDHVRSLHAPDEAVEAAVADVIGAGAIGSLLDLGTGTGRMLQLFAPRASRSVGVDSSHAMLAVARANLERAGLSRAELRQGDIYALPFGRNAFDVVLVHQVLHFLDDPARALREASAALAPGGRMIVIDFAAHDLEFLRTEHAHRRLGFTDDQIGEWCRSAGLDMQPARSVGHGTGDAAKLTVTLWIAADQRQRNDASLRIMPQREVA
ncbi:MAG: ArsR/SmtB family transcription factor [Bosea sp. (in: a-proteobacteria)]